MWKSLSFEGAVDLGHSPSEVGRPSLATPLMLTEVGAQVGLENAVGGGNSHGVGIGFVDIDNDGFEDIFVANGAGSERFRSALYRNTQDGRFVDVTEASGVAEIIGDKDTYSVAAGDYDADGDLDLYIGAHPRDVLLQNNGQGEFIDATEAASAGGPLTAEVNGRDGRSKIAAFGDYDGDGWLDVVVASSTFINHEANAYLLRNTGNGSFEDVSDATGVFSAPTGNPCAVFWSDFDNDGDQDLWIWNDRGDNRKNRVLLQNQDGVFQDITERANINDQVGNPMGIDGADINRDGYLDYYIADGGTNPLYLGAADGRFSQITEEAGTEGDFSWGLGFEDLNADSWPDIFVAQEDQLPYLSFVHNGALPPRFTRQDWTHAQVFGSQPHNVAVAFADYDHNGTIDIVTATTDGSRINLYRNDTPLGSNHWLEVRIPQVPGTGAKGGVSARVVVKTGDVIQFRDINGGSSRASQNATSVRFGLGAWDGAEWVAAIWPDGRELAVRNVPADQVLLLEP